MPPHTHINQKDMLSHFTSKETLKVNLKLKHLLI